MEGKGPTSTSSDISDQFPDKVELSVVQGTNQDQTTSTSVDPFATLTSGDPCTVRTFPGALPGDFFTDRQPSQIVENDLVSHAEVRISSLHDSLHSILTDFA